MRASSPSFQACGGLAARSLTRTFSRETFMEGEGKRRTSATEKA